MNNAHNDLLKNYEVRTLSDIIRHKTIESTLHQLALHDNSIIVNYKHPLLTS